VQKNHANPKSEVTGAKFNKYNTTKKAKELGENLVTYAMKQAWMASF